MHRAWIEAVAWWSPTLTDWAHAREVMRGGAEPLDPPARRPAPELLPPAERRRAPDTVAIACEVAARAVAAAGRAPRDLPSVFTSAHGDLAVTDALCATLASAPTAVSPTRFHNSVHNAASGYWGIATGCQRASTAMSAGDESFAAGLLEALVQCAAEDQPVLLVGYDIGAVGPLRSTNASRGVLGVALVLAPAPRAPALAALDWSLTSEPAAPSALRTAAARALASNAMHGALPFFEALALDTEAALDLQLAPRQALRLRLSM